MTEFVSEIKTIPYNEENIFNAISDLNNLKKVVDKIPQDKVNVKDLSFDADSCSFNVSPVGEIRFSIVDREPFKSIKLSADKSPIGITMWVQLKPSAENETKMKLTVKADINPFLKPMLSKPIQEVVDKIAEALASVPYNE